MSDNWVVQNFQNALTAWSEKLAEIWVLLTEEPEHFRGGDIWRVIFLLAKAIVTYGLELMLAIFEILCLGLHGGRDYTFSLRDLFYFRSFAAGGRYCCRACCHGLVVSWRTDF